MPESVGYVRMTSASLSHEQSSSLRHERPRQIDLCCFNVNQQKQFDEQTTKVIRSAALLQQLYFFLSSDDASQCRALFLSDDDRDHE
ncbi:jg26851 [Pararge aegeria aegeria]|uniref:Jg26851 protein n=1 Tax=Pararge aegeria aegeria TaxID=348720 RepID=A0A8S4SC25_9NEOP|nr:jg26851 [Pararge aegeria aegeria]